MGILVRKSASRASGIIFGCVAILGVCKGENFWWASEEQGSPLGGMPAILCAGQSFYSPVTIL